MLHCLQSMLLRKDDIRVLGAVDEYCPVFEKPPGSTIWDHPATSSVLVTARAAMSPVIKIVFAADGFVMQRRCRSRILQGGASPILSKHAFL